MIFCLESRSSKYLRRIHRPLRKCRHWRCNQPERCGNSWLAAQVRIITGFGHSSQWTPMETQYGCPRSMRANKSATWCTRSRFLRSQPSSVCSRFAEESSTSSQGSTTHPTKTGYRRSRSPLPPEWPYFLLGWQCDPNSSPRPGHCLSCTAYSISSRPTSASKSNSVQTVSPTTPSAATLSAARMCVSWLKPGGAHIEAPFYTWTMMRTVVNASYSSSMTLP